MADDATVVAPDVYRVLYENDRVRILEVSLPPGARTEMHAHPDYYVYILDDGGHVRFTGPDGEDGEVALPGGEGMWRPAEEHATENLGDTTLRAIFFEPK